MAKLLVGVQKSVAKKLRYEIYHYLECWLLQYKLTITTSINRFNSSFSYLINFVFLGVQ